MKKEMVAHFLSLVAFFAIITLYKRWFDPSYLVFWIGGVIGTLLPDIDHLVYVYFLRPNEVTSQRVRSLMNKHDFLGATSLLSDTHRERKNLIFHTITFQLVFIALVLLLVRSSGSVFSRGIVLAFSLHLAVNQLLDLMDTGNINSWLKYVPVRLDKKLATFYVTGAFVLLLILGVLM